MEVGYVAQVYGHSGTMALGTRGPGHHQDKEHRYLCVTGVLRTLSEYIDVCKSSHTIIVKLYNDATVPTIIQCTHPLRELVM